MFMGTVTASAADYASTTDFRGCGCATCRADVKSGFNATDFGVVDTIPNNGSTTAVVQVGGTLTAFISPDTDLDLIRLSVVQGQTYVVTMRGAGETPVNDTYLQIFNNLGQRIAYDDDGGAGVSSLINFTATATGTFFIRAAAFTTEGQAPAPGQYQVDVRAVPTVDTIPFSLATTATVQIGTTLFGFTETSGDRDMYRVELVAGRAYVFEAAGGYDYDSTDGGPNGSPFNREIDTRLVLYDAAGNQVAFNDDITGTDYSSRLGYLAPTSGTYFIGVAPYGGAIGGYTLDSREVTLDLTADPLDSIDWGTQLASTVVTVYFAAAGESFGGSGVSLGWNDYEIRQAMLALDTYADVSNLTFQITTDSANATFKLVTVNSDGYLGRFGPPDTGAFTGIGEFARNGFGWDEEGNGGLEQGGYGFVTLIHEFGHGLGLAHPHDNGGGSSIMEGVFSPFGSFGVFNLNQGVYTTMSYNTGWQTQPGLAFGSIPANNRTFGSEGTPGAFDLALMQRNYGADQNANAGNTTYTLRNVNAPGTFFTTIWDTSGIDTIAHAGAQSALIDLTAATLDYSPTGGGVVSFADGIFGGFTIANGVVIENASGGSGNDVLIGNAAANLLEGNAGDDRLMGGAGADILDGGAGYDTVSYMNATAGVSASFFTAGNTNSAGDAAGDRYISIEAIDGSNFDDTLFGGTRADTLNGMGGNDTIRGDTGADILSGGAGDDNIEGGTDNDTLNGDAGNDTLNGGNGIDTLNGGADNDTLVGGNEADVLNGGTGNDTLRGDNGNDVLNGGAGDDTLTGGVGNDIFLFADVGGRDTITDFRRGQDKVDVSDIDANSGLAGAQSFSFVGSRAFSGNGAAGQLRAYNEGGVNYLAGDTNGDGVADFTVVTGSVLLTQTDIIFI